MCFRAGEVTESSTESSDPQTTDSTSSTQQEATAGVNNAKDPPSAPETNSTNPNVGLESPQSPGKTIAGRVF